MKINMEGVAFMTPARPSPEDPKATQHSPSALERVAEALARIRFGSINLTVHEGKLVQLDITERTRFPS